MAKKMSVLTVILVAIGIGLVSSVLADVSRLDNARAHLIKARGLVMASEPLSVPGAPNRHVQRAQNLINQAIREIDLARSSIE